jgi:hypothetical protein
MGLKCENGTAEGKPQVEEYGLDDLAASAEAVLPGLGPLARLAGAVTLDAMELLALGPGRELLRWSRSAWTRRRGPRSASWR